MEYTRRMVDDSAARAFELLYMVKQFPFPEEVLANLSAKTLISWTAKWRRDCMQSCINAYKRRTSDPATKNGLENWKAKLDRPAPTNLASLIDDNRDDWTQLRERGYGQDAVLQLCDVGNKTRLTQHILCAALYDKEIKVLTGQGETGNNSILGCLRRHLRVLKEDKKYAEAYYAEKQLIDWYRVAANFVNALEHGEEGMSLHL
ncbi:hypothetical protein V7S43_015879 [Phytophthora oleae]|uniref:Uncharacterized protein n=1 Tax=Phytophthora oleae TaxID=2107226 RepID=A0ABD3EY39_9STRA